MKDGQIRSDKAQGQRRYILSLHLDVFTSRSTFAKDLNMFDFFNLCEFSKSLLIGEERTSVERSPTSSGQVVGVRCRRRRRRGRRRRRRRRRSLSYSDFPPSAESRRRRRRRFV